MCAITAHSQTTVTSSNLPIFIINTNGQTIGPEYKVMAEMKVVWHGDNAINNVNDIVYHYAGLIGIEFKGQSSLEFPKKSYSIELRNPDSSDFEFPLLDLPKNSDWVLSGPYNDKSLLRNSIAYKMAKWSDHYATRLRYCEVIVNNVYRGFYILQEKIKRDNDRVDISKMSSDDNSGDNLTGGYIVKIDKVDSFSVGWSSNANHIYPTQFDLFFQYVYPKDDEITPQQDAYIKQYILDFENNLGSSQWDDPIYGYNRYIDVNSFVDFMLIREVAKDVDSYKYSTYLFKDRNSQGGKLNLGPVWDFDLGFANEDFSNYGARDTMGWMYEAPVRAWWFPRLMEDSVFRARFRERYIELRDKEWRTERMMNYIDSITTTYADAINRNFTKWNILSLYVWPNSYIGNTYENEVNFLKTWLNDRLVWMDNQFGYVFQDTTSIYEIPQLTNISIYPNPATVTTTILIEKHAQKVNYIQLTDLSGKVLLQENNLYGNSQIELNIEHLTQGLYLVNVVGDGFIVTKKLMIVR